MQSLLFAFLEGMMSKKFGWIEVASMFVAALIVGYVAGRDGWPDLRKWQTLATGLIAIGVGFAAWRGVQTTIAANRKDTEDQINANRGAIELQIKANRQNTDHQLQEARQLFAHQMAVQTARERARIGREIDEVRKRCDGIAKRARLIAGRATLRGPHTVKDDPAIPSFGEADLSGLEEWLGENAHSLLLELMSSEESSLLWDLIQTAKVALKEPSELGFQKVAGEARAVLEVLDRVRARVEDWVPPTHVAHPMPNVEAVSGT
jgi:hypothetical protein